MGLIKKIDKESKIFYWLFGIMWFFIGLKKTDVGYITNDFFIPGYINLIGEWTPLIVFLIGGIIIVKFFSVKTANLIPLIFFYLFHLVMHVTQYFKNQNISVLLFSVALSSMLFILFGFCTLKSFKRNSLLYLESIIYGISIFFILSLSLEYTGIIRSFWNERFWGISGHVNFLGLAAVIGFLFSLFVEKGKHYLLMLINLYVVYLSGSRTALLAVILGIFIYLYLYIKVYKLKFLIVLGGLFVIFIFFSMFSIEDIFVGERGFNRDDTWSTLYERAIEFRFFGIGKGDTSTAQSYLYALVATGVLGFSFLFTAIVSKLLLFFQYHKSLHRELFLSLFLVLLITALAEGFLLDRLSITSVTFWMLLSLPTNIVRK